MDQLKSVITLCSTIYEMHTTFTSNKGQCAWLLSKVQNIQRVLEEQLARSAFPEALENPLVVLEENLRAANTVLEEFGRCHVVMRFISGSKHARQFLEAGDRLNTSYTTLCHAVSILLALDERDHAAHRDDRIHLKLNMIMQKLDLGQYEDAEFEDAYQRDVQECEEDLAASMRDPELSAKLIELGLSFRVGTRSVLPSHAASAAVSRTITTYEEALTCSWYLQSDNITIDYKEIKRGQTREIRLGKPGSFGDVFSAVLCDGTPVAVKKLKLPTKIKDLATSRDCAASFSAFVREVSFGFSLKHPNVVRTLGGVVDAEEEPPCWIVMERLNVSLAEIPVDMDKKLALDEKQKLDILLGICSALVYLHSSNRAASNRESASEPSEEDPEFAQSHSHRDLKPENIMIQDGVAKLIDFGVAKMSRHSTRGTSVQGTYNWMSPEQALTDARKTYTQCDIFSFGLVFKWLMLGDRDDVPFKDTPTDLIISEHRRIHTSGGLVLHPFVADLSLLRPEYRSIVQFCTAVDAKKRWTAPKAMWELRQLKSRLAFAFPAVFGGESEVQDKQHSGPTKTGRALLQPKPEIFTTPPKTGRVSSPAPPTSPDAACFYAGARVRLGGLKAQPEMNGSSGVIRRGTATGKWVVLLDSDKSEKEVSPQNMTLISQNLAAACVAWCEEKALHIRTVGALNASKNIVLEGDSRWVLDASKAACSCCSSDFGLLTRRHHCRICGDVFCSSCSQHQKRGCVGCLALLEAGKCPCSSPDHQDLRVCTTCHAQGCLSPIAFNLQRQLQAASTRITALEQHIRLCGGATDSKSLVSVGCSLELLKGANVDADISALKATGCDAGALKTAGADLASLQSAGFTLAALLQAGFDISSLLKAKFSIVDLKSSGVSASAFRSAGCSMKELADIGFDVLSLKSAKFPLEDLKSRFSVELLLEAGYEAAALRKAGFSALELRSVGMDVGSLKAAGYSLVALKSAMIDLSELRSVFDLSELRSVGFDVVAFKNAGYQLEELKSAGYDAASLKSAGFDAPSMRAVGFSCSTLFAAGCSAAMLKSAGFSVQEMHSAGCDATALRLCGFDAATLKGIGLLLADLKSAGFAAEELVGEGVGYDARALHSVGFDALSLKRHFSARDLRDAGYSAAQLKDAGIEAASLRAAGFTPSDLLAARYDVAIIRAAGYSQSDFATGFDLAALSVEDVAYLVFSTGDGDDFTTYAYATLDLKVKGITIAHADEDELNELLKQINISVVHRVELKAAIASWRGDAWQSMHSLEKGRLRHQAAAAHDAEYMEKSVEFKKWSVDQLRSLGSYSAHRNMQETDVLVANCVGQLMSLSSAADMKQVCLRISRESDECNLFVQEFARRRLEQSHQSYGLLGRKLAKKSPKAVIFDAQALRATGYNLQTMKKAGYAAASLRAAGYDLSSLLKVCYSAAELKSAGFTEDLGVAVYRAAGCSWADVKTAGFTVAEAKAAGCDLASANSAGYDLSSFKAGGYDVAAFRAAGCSWADVNKAGFTIAEAEVAGCDLASANSAGYSWADVNKAGFTIAEARAAGCDPASANSAGYNLISIVEAFGLDAAIAAGCDVSFILCHGSNLYMTLHRHKVDDRTIVEDGQQPLPVPAGWQIAEGNADDIRVCAAHPWQSDWLVFANGDAYGTAACRHSSHRGKKGGGGRLIQDAQGVTASDYFDVLLRRRA